MRSFSETPTKALPLVFFLRFSCGTSFKAFFVGATVVLLHPCVISLNFLSFNDDIISGSLVWLMYLHAFC